jgi:hypothetical protein
VRRAGHPRGVRPFEVEEDDLPFERIQLLDEFAAQPLQRSLALERGLVVAKEGVSYTGWPFRTMFAMDPRDIRTWAANHQAAAAREAEEARRHPLTSAEAFASALALLAFDEKQNGSPYDRPDAVTAREDEQMWEDWAKLRARWRNGR